MSSIGIKELALRARRTLHDMPELAFDEKRTLKFIADFLKEHTSLEIHIERRWLYAVHREDADTSTAVRADFDAVPYGDSAKHLCGHDGHTASLLALALKLEGKRIGKNVILLFQPAEETGAGAPVCCELFKREKVNAIVGAHNIPGKPMGQVLLKRGTFACASCGMEIVMNGSPTHAAYPENGVNPTAAIASLALKIPHYAQELSSINGCMTLATVVGMQTGKRAFGVAASDGKLWVTLRSEHTELLDSLRAYASSEAEKLASEQGLSCTVDFFDVFPATVNDDSLLENAVRTFSHDGIACSMLDEPFRWSEDFGHYGHHVPSLFIGIGSGENTPPLHTADYEYPDELVDVSSDIFLRILDSDFRL